MLRTTANALWGRFVPAARQQLTGAGAASVSRVRESSRRRARRRFAGEPIARYFLLVSFPSRSRKKHRIADPSSSPVSLLPQRTFVSSAPVGEEADPHAVRHRPERRPEHAADATRAPRSVPSDRVRCSLTVPSLRIRFPRDAAPPEPVRPSRALRRCALLRRLQGRKHSHRSGGAQDGASPLSTPIPPALSGDNRDRYQGIRGNIFQSRRATRRSVAIQQPNPREPALRASLTLPSPPPNAPDGVQVIDAANSDAKFKQFLEDPTMPKAKKIAGLTAFCDGAKFAPITKSFLCVVAENGRLDQNEKIYECLEEYTLAAAGQVKATVTSAQPLTPEQLADLTKKLQVHVEKGETLKVDTKVDPRLVGGFTVAMGEDFFDLSLMSRIRAMEAELAKPLNA